MFIGKVSDEVGFEKTMKLLLEARETIIKHEKEINEKKENLK